MNYKIEKTLYDLANKSFMKNEIPIAALLVDENDKIIAKASNLRHKNNDVFGHAEILAMKKAARKLHNWKLNKLTLIVTFEPCMMCTGAILQSGIKNIIFMYDEPKYGFINSNHTFDLTKINVQKIKPEVNDFNHLKLMRKFFIQLRFNKSIHQKEFKKREELV